MRAHLIKMVYRRTTDAAHVYRAETAGVMVKGVSVVRALFPARPPRVIEVTVKWEEK